MWINDAADLLIDHAKHASDRRSSITFEDLAHVLLSADTRTAKAWAAKTERVIAHVQAGNHTSKAEDAARFFNRHYSSEMR